MAGLEVAIGFLIAWTVRRAKHLSDGLGVETDKLLDKALGALHRLIAEKLAGDPALAQLQDETERDGEPNSRTTQRVQLALEDAVEQDAAFASSLDALIKEAERAVRRMNRHTTHNSGVVTDSGLGVVAGSVSASDHGMAFGSVVGSVSVTQASRSVATCRNCSRDAIGQCLECHDPLCGVHNLATRQRAIATPNLVATRTVQALWRAAADKVLCGDCLTRTEEDLLHTLPVTPLPNDPRPVVRLIELADRTYWSTRQHMGAWMDALYSAVEELGGQLAVFDAAAAAVLNRTEIEEFRGARRGEAFQGAVAGEEVRTYQFDGSSTPTGRLIAVNSDLDWFYVRQTGETGRYGVERITGVALHSVSSLVDLAIPAFTDYVYYPQAHDLMPDLWSEGEQSCTHDERVLSTVLAAHHWI